MRITRAQVDNFLGVSSIDVHLKTPVAMFCGPNGAGKSSLQEAIRVALTRDTVRGVESKKNFDQLVHEGVKAGGALITTDDGRDFAFDMPSGKFSVEEVPEPMRVALHGQRFARMPADERRTFLFGLTGCKATPELVRQRMVDRECDKAKIEAVVPMLRTGFPNACEFAKTKATEAKGAWRTVTGETYGSKKAEGWKAEKPVATGDATGAKETLTALETEITDLNQKQGSLATEARALAEAAQKRAALKSKADGVDRVRENLGLAQKELADYEPTVVALRGRAKGTARVGLVHDMANFLSRAPFDSGEDSDEARALLDRYEGEHGSLNDAGTPDLMAQASLPDHESGLTVLKNKVKNLQRDLSDAEGAKAAFDALAPAEGDKPDPQIELAQVQSRLGVLKASRDNLQVSLRAIEDVQRKIDQADEKTKKATQNHADVVAWSLVADALAPDGIPGELLAEALKPINTTLQIAARETGWMPVTIAADMSITAAGRAYALLSESEQWRTDAMIAYAVAKLSGLKLLMLDRVDVLLPKGRVELLTWLDELAQDDKIDGAILFCSTKAFPTGLPDTITPYWIESGALKEFKQAA